jgi:BirA family biotin operon repressor/biotin-[acetyl-CoA-carboxylase] ligase
MELLDAERVSGLLATAAYGRSLDVRAETGSTNDDARDAAARGAARGHVVVADTQSRGRGARGRTWSSPPGLDLYVSIVERLEVAPERLAPLTLAVGLGVADAVAAIAPRLQPEVKWPNDVWIGRRKCAGILVETSSAGARIEAIVIGIGFGVNRLDFEGELAESATSIAREHGAIVDRARALASLLEHVERWVDRFAAEGPAPVIAALERRLALRGERVTVDDVEGTVIGIAPSGAIRIATERGERTVISGTLRPADRAAQLAR